MGEGFGDGGLALHDQYVVDGDGAGLAGCESRIGDDAEVLTGSSGVC